MYSFLVRPARAGLVFNCHMKSPNNYGCQVYARLWGFHRIQFVLVC